MDPSGRESGNKRGIVAPITKSAIVEPVNDKESVLHQLPKLVMESIDNHLKECMTTPTENLEEKSIESPSKEIDVTKELELIETLDFKNGENSLSIRFSKKHNRMFRIQVFLNGVSEIRPVTYTGASTGYGLWNLLKGSLKK